MIRTSEDVPAQASEARELEACDGHRGARGNAAGPRDSTRTTAMTTTTYGSRGLATCISMLLVLASLLGSGAAACRDSLGRGADLSALVGGLPPGQGPGDHRDDCMHGYSILCWSAARGCAERSWAAGSLAWDCKAGDARGHGSQKNSSGPAAKVTALAHDGGPTTAMWREAAYACSDIAAESSLSSSRAAQLQWLREGVLYTGCERHTRRYLEGPEVDGFWCSCNSTPMRASRLAVGGGGNGQSPGRRGEDWRRCDSRGHEEVRRSQRPCCNGGQCPVLQMYLALDVPLLGNGCGRWIRGRVAWPPCGAALATGGADLYHHFPAEGLAAVTRVFRCVVGYCVSLQLDHRRWRKRRRSTCQACCDCHRCYCCPAWLLADAVTGDVSCIDVLTCVRDASPPAHAHSEYCQSAQVTHSAGALLCPAAVGNLYGSLGPDGHHSLGAGGATAARPTHEVSVVAVWPRCGLLGAGEVWAEEEHYGTVPCAVQDGRPCAAAAPRGTGRGIPARCPCVVCQVGRRSANCSSYIPGPCCGVDLPRPPELLYEGHGYTALPSLPVDRWRPRLCRSGCTVRSPWSPGGMRCKDCFVRQSSYSRRGVDAGEAVRSPARHAALRRGRRDGAEGVTSLRPARGRRRNDEGRRQDDDHMMMRCDVDEMHGTGGTTICSPEDDGTRRCQHWTAADVGGGAAGSMRRWECGREERNATAVRRPRCIAIQHCHCYHPAEAAGGPRQHHLHATIDVGRRTVGRVGGPRSGQVGARFRSRFQCRLPHVARHRPNTDGYHHDDGRQWVCVWGGTEGVGAAAGKRRAAPSPAVPCQCPRCVLACTSPAVGQVPGTLTPRDGADGDGVRRADELFPETVALAYRAPLPGPCSVPGDIGAPGRAFPPGLVDSAFAHMAVYVACYFAALRILMLLPRTDIVSRGCRMIYTMLFFIFIGVHKGGGRGMRCAWPPRRVGRTRMPICGPCAQYDGAPVRTTARARRGGWARRRRIYGHARHRRPGRLVGRALPTQLDLTCANDMEYSARHRQRDIPLDWSRRTPLRPSSRSIVLLRRRREPRPGAPRKRALCLVYVWCALLHGPGGGRIGEADNPGPPLLNFFDDPEGEGEMEEGQPISMTDVVDEPFCEPPEGPVDRPPTPLPCAEDMNVDEVGPTIGDRQLGGRGAERAGWFMPANCFHGAVPGWAFKKGGSGLGYYRECGQAVILLAEILQPPARPRPISIFNALFGGMGTAPRHRCGGDADGARADLAIAHRAHAAVYGVAPRRRPRTVPRRRTAARRRRRALPMHAPRPGVVSDFRADDAWHRPLGLWAIDSANANTWDTAKGYIELSAADVVAVQETKLRGGHPILKAQREAVAIGWRFSAEGCDVTESGYPSAGVGVAVRSHLGMAVPPVQLDDPELRHRVHIRWIGSVCKGGLFLASMYLWNGERLSPRNMALLQAAAAALATCGPMWVIMADFQVSPAELLRSGWPDFVGGVVVAPPQATCMGNTIDYCVVSQALSPAVHSIAVVADSTFYPHSPVRLTIRAAPRRLLVRRLAAPRRVPAHLPHACLADWDKDGALVEKSIDTGDELDDAYCRFVTDAEAVWCSIDGCTDKRAIGARAQGPRMRWVPALGPPSSQHRFSSFASRLWRTAARHLHDIVRAEAFGGHGPSLGTAAQADRAWRRLCAAAAPSRHDNHEVGLHRAWAAALVRQRHRCAEDWTLLVEEAVCHAVRAENATRKAMEHEWRAWIHGGPCKGLGRQHRYSRTPVGWVPTRAVNGVAMFNDEMDGDDVDDSDLRIMSIPPDEPACPPCSQGTVEAEANVWARHWDEASGQAEVRWPANMGTVPEAFVVDQMLTAACTFAEGTGLGWDNLHPRAILRLPRRLLQRLVDILLAAERIGRWPQAIALVLISLLPKPDGGLRPIGLMPMVIRLWSRTRRIVAQRWEAAWSRPYFYAGPRKGALVASWRQAFRADVARAVAAKYAQALLDIIKCFEHVPYQALVDEARRVGYCLYTLRLSVSSYLMRRVIGIARVYSRVVRAARGITAGSVWATTELRVLLVRAMDRATRLYPRAALTLYVDDASTEASGTTATVVRDVIGITTEVCKGFEGVGLSVSNTKNQCTASDHELGRTIAEGLSAYGVTFAARVKSLGVQLGAGVRRCSMVARRRMRSFAARARRFMSLRKARVNVARIVRTGGNAAMTFGQEVTGVADHILLGQRRAAAAAVSTGGEGKDIDLVLIAADADAAHGSADPAFAAHVGPLRAWAEAVWEGWFPLATMDLTIARARCRLVKARRVWSAVHSPAAAVLATAARIGWDFASATKVTTHDGLLLDLAVDSPAAVAAHVRRAVERWRWRRLAARYPHIDPGGDGGGVNALPILRLLRGNDNTHAWGPAQRALLRSAWVNGQWPQARLAAAALSPDHECQMCKAALLRTISDGDGTAACDHGSGLGTHPEVPRGTLLHRYYECQHVYDECRRRLLEADALDTLHGIDEVRRQAAQAAALQEAGGEVMALPAWTRAILPSPAYLVPPPSKDGTFVWVKQPDDARVGGHAYVDASGLDGPDPLTLRIGWAFAVFDAEGGLLAAAYGATPQWVTSVTAGEAYALMMVIDVVLPEAWYVTDCLSSVATAQRGVAWATGPSRPNARIWRRIFHVWDDGEAGKKILWVPAHTTARDIGVKRISDGTPLTATQARRNAYVDALAKRGAATHRVPEDIRSKVTAARDAAWWMGVTIGHLAVAANQRAEAPHRDSLPTVNRRGGHVRRPRRRERAVLAPRPLHLGGHDVTRTRAGWKCTVCRCTSTRYLPIAAGRCTGPAADRWARRARALAAAQAQPGAVGSDGAGHRRFITDDTVWCDRCGAYADSFAVGLARPCPGRPTCAGKEQHLRRLRRGFHPATAAAFRGVPIPEPAIGAHARPAAAPPTRSEAWGTGAQQAGRGMALTGVAAADPAERRCRAARADHAAARVAAVQQRVRERVGATTARRRITGKTTPAGGTACVRARPRPGDGGEHNLRLDHHGDDREHHLVRVPHEPPPHRRRLDDRDDEPCGEHDQACGATLRADAHAVTREPTSGLEVGPVIAAPSVFNSRAQLLASLAEHVHGCRVRCPSTRGDAASDCLVDGGGKRSRGDDTAGARAVRPRLDHDQRGRALAAAFRGGGGGPRDGACPALGERAEPAGSSRAQSSVSDAGSVDPASVALRDTPSSATELRLDVAVVPQPGQRGGGIPQPAGQAVPEAAFRRVSDQCAGHQHASRQQLLRALRGAD